jgi:hypothetical protein
MLGLLYVSEAIIPQMIEENQVTSSTLALLLPKKFIPMVMFTAPASMP